MAGGLINIITYGSQDLYLTGTPQITHFKVIYRRHTNFSMESVRIKFDDMVEFGEETNIIIPKAGDLIGPTYLEITLPEINFSRTINQTNVNNLTTKLNNLQTNYTNIFLFQNINFNTYRNIYQDYIADNDTSPDSMLNTIKSGFTQDSLLSDYINLVPDINNLITTIKSIISNTVINPNSIISSKYTFNHFVYEFISIYSVLDNTYTEDKDGKNALWNDINAIINKSNIFLQYFEEQIIITKKQLEDELTPNYKFAWVDRIGHSILEYVQVSIGGEIIDKHYGEWINVLFELIGSDNYEDKYLKMIGDIPELTNFNRISKPKTTIIIPLYFWFCRFNGLALPLVALQYNDVMISIKLRKFSECSYIESNSEGAILDDLYEDLNKQISMNLLVDYIYLDSLERRKFAQSAHEYLIDVIQYNEDETTIDEHSMRLDFTNPSKEVIFITQRESFITNENGTNKCMWNNYTSNLDGTENPIVNAIFEIQGQQISDKQNGNYYNYALPYYFHNKTPSDGVNIISFSLMPEENQPSGSLNFSRLNIVNLKLLINQNMFGDVNNPDNVIIKVFSVSSNILRLIGGMGQLAFT